MVSVSVGWTLDYLMKHKDNAYNDFKCSQRKRVSISPLLLNGSSL
jgi:hypothetical protein